MKHFTHLSVDSVTIKELLLAAQKKEITEEYLGTEVTGTIREFIDLLRCSGFKEEINCNSTISARIVEFYRGKPPTLLLELPPTLYTGHNGSSETGIQIPHNSTSCWWIL